MLVWDELCQVFLPLLQVGDSLEEFLLASTDDGKLRQLMMSMSEAIRTIAFKVRKDPVQSYFFTLALQTNPTLGWVCEHK